MQHCLCYYVFPASQEINSAAAATIQWLDIKLSYLHCIVADHSALTSLLRFLCLWLFCCLLLTLLCLTSHNQRTFHLPYITCYLQSSLHQLQSKLERHSVECIPPTKEFPRLAVNTTILKPRVTAATGAQYLYVGFSRRNKIPRCSVYNIGESNRFRHPYYNPDRAEKLMSSSMSRHLSTHNTSSKSMRVFLSNLANRQTNTGKNIYLLLCRR